MKKEKDKKPRVGGVVHCLRSHYDVYIGRNPEHHGIEKAKTPEYPLHNPYEIGKDGTRREVIEKFEKHVETLLNDPNFVKAVRDLDGKTLGCWCWPNACHGDVLLKIARDLRLKERRAGVSQNKP